MNVDRYGISFFSSYYDNKAVTKHLTFNEIVSYFNNVATKRFISKDKIESVICGLLKGGNRHTDDLINRSILTYDIDYYKHNTDSIISYLKDVLKSLTYILYTTVSSTKKKPKVRVLIFLDVPVTKNQYSILAKAVAKDIFKDLFLEHNFETQNNTDSAIDEASYSSMQMMNLPIKINDDFRAGKNLNKPLCVARYLDSVESTKTDEIDAFIRTVKNTPKNISDEKIKYILSKYICSDTDYNSWLRVCQALHHQYRGDNVGLDVFTQWSLTDSRYKKEDIIRECAQKYYSIRSDIKNPITFASIIQIVNEKYCQPQKLDKNIPMAIDKQKFVHIKFNTKGEISGIKSTYENFKIMCEEYNIKIAYDVIIKRNFNSFNNIDDNLLSGKMTSLMELNDLKVKNVDKYINMLAHENAINSFKDVLNKITWDGKSRLNEFYNTVTVDVEYEETRNLYLLKWLQQMLYLTTYNGHRKIARNLLVFQSDQSSGKSTWVRSLLPEKMSVYIGEGLQLNTNDPMSILTCIRHIFVELAELEQSFKKTDINAFKAFYGRTVDTLNIKYLSYPVSYPRTTSFLGTVNDKRFLKDRTGSTRFLVLPVKRLNGYHKIDMLMLYKEILETTDYINFELDSSDKEKQRLINEQFEQPNLIEEQFTNIFETKIQKGGEFKSCTEILEQIGYSKRDINHSKRVELEIILDKYNFEYRHDIKKWKVKIKNANKL